MKKFEDMGFTSIVTSDKLKIEIPIKNLVCAFEACPDNHGEVTIKRGKRQAFAEWLAQMIVSECDPEDGSSYLHKMFDSVFDQIFQGYELCDEFIKYTEEEDDD